MGVEKVQRRRHDEGFSAPVDAQQELIEDLCRSHAQISPKYFYDELGSKLFEAICLLDEYYLTRSEAAIFEQFLPEIAEAAGLGTTLVDLGAGNCAKAARLFDSLRPRQYVPIDISAEFLRASVAKLQMEHPSIPMIPIGMDFTNGLTLPPKVGHEQRLFFYPGSSLGNFTPLQAGQFLSRIRNLCQAGKDRPDSILIGIDLIKDEASLEAAYDDAVGVTAAFNLNILRHVNKILSSNFDIHDWQHRATFNQAQSRIEMHLEARRDLTVRWPGGSRSFSKAESIHSENSYKYSRTKFVELLAQAGFGEVTSWTDSKNFFLVCHAKAI